MYGKGEKHGQKGNGTVCPYRAAGRAAQRISGQRRGNGGGPYVYGTAEAAAGAGTGHFHLSFAALMRPVGLFLWKTGAGYHGGPALSGRRRRGRPAVRPVLPENISRDAAERVRTADALRGSAQFAGIGREKNAAGSVGGFCRRGAHRRRGRRRLSAAALSDSDKANGTADGPGDQSALLCGCRRPFPLFSSAPRTGGEKGRGHRRVFWHTRLPGRSFSGRTDRSPAASPPVRTSDDGGRSAAAAGEREKGLIFPGRACVQITLQNEGSGHGIHPLALLFPLFPCIAENAVGHYRSHPLVPQFHRHLAFFFQAAGKFTAAQSPFPLGAVHVGGQPHQDEPGLFLGDGLAQGLQQPVLVIFGDAVSPPGQQFGGVGEGHAGTGIPQVQSHDHSRNASLLFPSPRKRETAEINPIIP